AERGGLTTGDAENRPEEDLSTLLQPAAIVPEAELGRPDLGRAAVALGQADALDQIADEPSAKVRVSKDRTADRSRGPCPCFEAGGATADRPAHQTVDGHCGVGADVPVVEPPDLAVARAQDETADASIGDENVRAAAEERDRDCSLRGNLQRPDDLIAAARLQQPVRRAADPERRQILERL